MAGDFSKPVVTDNYALVYTPTIVENMKALAQGLDPAVVNPANLPINTIRWNSVNKHDEIFTGTTWVEKCDIYAISISGNSETSTYATNAGTANALNNSNNYSVHSAITFNNGGVGSGYMVSNEPTWGFLHRPSINGTSAAHTWTDAAGSVIGYLGAQGNLSVAKGVRVQGTTTVAGTMGYDTSARGLYLWGKAGVTNDFELLNDAGTTVARVPTGTTNLFVTGAVASKSWGFSAYADLIAQSLFTSWYNLTTGSPTGVASYFSGFNSTLAADNAYGWQLAGQAQGGAAAALYIRKKDNNAYGAWTRMLDAAYVAANTLSVGALTSTGAISGPGTGLTGTAAGLNIGGSAAVATVAVNNVLDDAGNLGLGICTSLYNPTGATINAGSTIVGQLKPVYCDTAGNYTVSGTAVTGTWRNVSGINATAGSIANYQRIS